MTKAAAVPPKPSPCNQSGMQEFSLDSTTFANNRSSSASFLRSRLAGADRDAASEPVLGYNCVARVRISTTKRKTDGCVHLR